LRAIPVLPISLLLISCGNYNSTQNQRNSQVKLRAFVSNPLQPTISGAGFPALDIVDASKDLMSPFTVSLLGSVPDAGMMALSPNKARTLVYSPSNNQLVTINNSTESPASGVSAVTLPGRTESVFIASDNKTAFAAVPGAIVNGQPSGVVERIDISRGAITATVPIPAAHFLALSPDGNRILVFSDNSNLVTVLSPALLGSPGAGSTQQACGAAQTAVCTIAGFDRPVGAVFDAGGGTAYVMNCGGECGGTASGVAFLDLSQSPPAVTATVPVPGATVGWLNAGTLYVAGTPPFPLNDCAGVTTAATSCGRLSVIDISGASVINATPLPIADGHHDRMQMGSNGQLFIGSRGCSSVIIAGGEVRGCLSIVNTASGEITESSIVAPPQAGDVTGIEPIPHRNVVYVCQGGGLEIYDTTTDKLQATQVKVVGQAIDVKVVDF